MADAIEPIAPGNGLLLNMAYGTTAEADKAFAGLAEGGTVKYPLALQPFGLYYGEVTDKYGVCWMITAETQPNPS